MALNSRSRLSVAMLTKEWPPEIYGGAGVHITNLVAAMKRNNQCDLTVNCFGLPRNDATNFDLSKHFKELNSAEQALLVNLDMATKVKHFDLIHSHTWYTNFAGYLLSQISGKPHVMTAHSLEPLRPWKAEQLGSGYELSSWIEKKSIENAAAIIAVSDDMRKDVIRNYSNVDPKRVVTIRNGIDTTEFSPKLDEQILRELGIVGEYALFVGRITRQKGLPHLLRAWQSVPEEYGLVIAASSPDEPGIATEVEKLINDLIAKRNNVIWIKETLSKSKLITLLTSANVFVCPSIYEPLGIVNLEAMACETAVVASKIGGIPEVVKENETGLLVELNEDYKQFEAGLSEAIIKVMSDKTLAQEFGIAGRKRAINEFSWDKVVSETLNLYRSLNV